MMSNVAESIVPKFAKVARIDLDKLLVDSKYQRDLRTHIVNRIVRKFNADLCTPLVVNDRGNDVYAVVDGQHRLAALRELKVRSHYCYVLNVDRHEEARMFVSYQMERMAIGVPERHRALVFAGDETAVRIDGIIKSMGLRLDAGNDVVGVVHAIGATYAVYGHGTIRGDAEGHLRNVLRVLKEAWGYSPLAYAAQFLRGVSVFLFTYPEITTSTLSERLARSDPRRALTAMREATGSQANASAKAAALVVTDLFNRGLKSGRLDPSAVLLTTSRLKGARPAVSKINRRGQKYRNVGTK